MDKYAFLGHICRLLNDGVESNRSVKISSEASKILLDFIAFHGEKWGDSFLKSLSQLAREYSEENHVSYKKAYSHCWYFYNKGNHRITTINNRVFVVLGPSKKPDKVEEEVETGLSKAFPYILKVIEGKGLIPTPLLLIKDFELTRADAHAFMKWYTKLMNE